MGYPLSYQRLLHRNHLHEGDYEDLPAQFRVSPILDGYQGTDMSEDMVWLARRPIVIDRIKGYEQATSLLLGDLRRLERDTLDEGAICETIATKTGIDRDTVAAVLQAWLQT